MTPETQTAIKRAILNLSIDIHYLEQLKLNSDKIQHQRIDRKIAVYEKVKRDFEGLI